MILSWPSTMFCHFKNLLVLAFHLYVLIKEIIAICHLKLNIDQNRYLCVRMRKRNKEVMIKLICHFQMTFAACIN